MEQEKTQADRFEEIGEGLLRLLDRFDAPDCDLDKTEEDALPEYIRAITAVFELGMPELRNMAAQNQRVERQLFEKVADKTDQEKTAELELAFLIYNQIMELSIKLIEDLDRYELSRELRKISDNIDNEEGRSFLLMGLRVLILLYFAAKKDMSGQKIGALITRFLDACVRTASLVHQTGEDLTVFEGLDTKKRALFLKIIASRVFDGLSTRDIQDIASERITLLEL